MKICLKRLHLGQSSYKVSHCNPRKCQSSLLFKLFLYILTNQQANCLLISASKLPPNFRLWSSYYACERNLVLFLTCINISLHEATLNVDIYKVSNLIAWISVQAVGLLRSRSQVRAFRIWCRKLNMLITTGSSDKARNGLVLVKTL